MIQQDLYTEIGREWRATRHNATLLHSMPNFATDQEAESFWDRLYWHNEQLTEEIQTEIEGKYGVRLEWSSYGRSGATFAPSDWVRDTISNMDLDTELAISQLTNYNLPDSLGRYQACRKLLAILRRNNEFWNDAANNIATWWEDHKILAEPVDDDEPSIEELVGELLAAPPVEWDERVTALGEITKQNVGYYLEGLCEKSARLLSYVEMRGALGSGDHGHKAAVRDQNRLCEQNPQGANPATH